MASWSALADRILGGGSLSRDEALAVLRCPDDELLALLDAAYRVRRRHFGNRVQVHILSNAKSGACPEDCAYCSQSAFARSGVERTAFVGRAALIEQARRAKEAGARMFCMVTATRAADDLDLDEVCAAVSTIRRQVGIKVCASLGLLSREAAGRLATAGVNRFNHNLETSERHFPAICSTHSYADRVASLRHAREAGMELCSGGIVGMGETDEDVVDLAFATQAESIPVNFLDPRPGTPLSDAPRQSPQRCLKVLCLFRFVHPTSEIRAAGGREANLGSLEPLCLYPANSIFADGYLTTPGSDAPAVMKMIADMGMEAVPE